MNSIEWFTDKLNNPIYIDWDVRNYFPKELSFPLTFGEIQNFDIKRTALLALPFLSLNSSIGKAISLPLNGMRALTNLSSIHEANFLSYDQGVAVIQLTLTVITIAGSFFSFKLGMTISSLADVIQSLKTCLEHLSQEEYKKFFNELLYTLSSTLYFGTIYCGSIEIVIASLLLKATLSGIESYSEYAKEKYPEAIAKFAMGMIRLKNVHTQYQFLQRRNFLNGLEKFQSLLEKIHKSKKIDHLYDHPLTSLNTKIENGTVIFHDDDGNSYDFGAHFHGLGGKTVKGMNITFTKKDNWTELEFKVNHVARKKIEANITSIQKLQRNNKEFTEFLKLNGIEKHELKITTKTKANHPLRNPKEYFKIFSNDSVIEIGADENLINSYDIVKVKMPLGKTIYELHKVLSFFGLEEALRKSSLDDLERMKLGHLFHTLSPRKALKLERTDTFFSLSTKALKNKMIAMDPSIKKGIDTYLHKMKLHNILPGRKRLHIESLSKDLLKQFGDFHLTTLLMGTNDIKKSSARLASILQMGLMSKEIKENAGLMKKGLVTDGDHFGSNDSTFVQAVTTQKRYDEFFYSLFSDKNSSIRLIIDPKLLDSGTYQYHNDICGHRKKELIDPLFGFFQDRPSNNYNKRDNIEEFLAKEFEEASPKNEVMIKDGIPQEYITAIVVDTIKMKEGIINYMTKMGHLENGILFGRKVESFIQVGQEVDHKKVAKLIYSAS